MLYIEVYVYDFAMEMDGIMVWLVDKKNDGKACLLDTGKHKIHKSIKLLLY
jgi:hypothetical protein